MSCTGFLSGGSYSRVCVNGKLSTWIVHPERPCDLTIEKARHHLLVVLAQHGEPHAVAAEVENKQRRGRSYTFILQRTSQPEEVTS